jgi:hypothetical protein
MAQNAYPSRSTSTSVSPVEPRIADARPEYAPPPFAQAPTSGYIHLAAAVEPPRGRTPFPRGGPRRASLLGRLKILAAELERQGAVRTATVFRAVVLPPAPPGAAHPARYDVSVLLEADSPRDLDAIRASEPYERMAAEITDVATDVHEMEAHCLRFLGEVGRNDRGLFLFNYFTAKDPEPATRVWEHLAGWYVTETGLDNSCLLAPLGTSDYVFVNHARWDMSLPRFAFRQFSRRSFRTYVLGNLRANGITAMPVFYRVV